MNLQSLTVPLLLDISNFVKGIDSAVAKAGGLQNGMSKIGGGIVVGGLALIGAGIAGVTLVTKNAIKESTDWGIVLDDIGDILGTDTAQSAGLGLMTKRLGMDTKQLTNAMALMAKGLTNAKGELGPTGLAIQNLGINIYDTNGKLKDSVSLFQEVADVIGNMPDGLEKTSLMMDIFGKSGKEMGDLLGIAANGGVAQFIEEAKKLGLSFTPEQVQQVIDYGKAQQKLSATLLGLKTVLGMKLIPVFTKFNDVISNLLADPKIKAGINSFADALSSFAIRAIESIPKVIEMFQNIVAWFQNNQPVVIGILAAMGVAVGIWAYQMIQAAIATAAALWPVYLVLGIITAAVILFVKAWNSNFMGIQTTLTNLWAQMQPIFAQMVLWFQINIPIAIQYLANIWTTVLLPALTAIWNFISLYFLPLLQALGNFVLSVLNLAFQTLGLIFQQIIIPVFNVLWGVLTNLILPVLEAVASFVAGALVAAFKALVSIINAVTGAVNALAGALMKLRLPRFFTPGSPFPFTDALVGMNKELRRSANAILPEFSAQLNLGGRNPTLSSAPANNANNNMELIKAIKENNKETFDYEKFAIILRDTVLREI